MAAGGSAQFAAGLGQAKTPALFAGDVNPIKQMLLTPESPNVGGLSPAQLLAAIKPPTLPSVGGGGGTSTAPGMGTYGNSLPTPGNQGNPNSPSAQQAQAIGRRLAAQQGWSGAEWNALNNVAMRESGWNANAVNKSSGAYGIPQALGHGTPFQLGDAVNQIKWMLNYIRSRYGDPVAAWQHETSQGWY